MVSVRLVTVACISLTSCGRRARQRSKATATSTASRMPSRISHFRRACERVRCGGCGSDVSTIAGRPSVEAACGSVWDAGVRDASVRDRSAWGNISFHPPVRGPPLAGQTACRVRYLRSYRRANWLYDLLSHGGDDPVEITLRGDSITDRSLWKGAIGLIWRGADQRHFIVEV